MKYKQLLTLLCVYVMPLNTLTTVLFNSVVQVCSQHESVLIPCHNEVDFHMALRVCLPNTNHHETLYLVRFTKPGLSTHTAEGRGSEAMRP